MITTQIVCVSYGDLRACRAPKPDHVFVSTDDGFRWAYWRASGTTDVRSVSPRNAMRLLALCDHRQQSHESAYRAHHARQAARRTLAAAMAKAVA